MIDCSFNTIREYLTKVSHYYSNAIKGIENWYIGPNCIFKTKEQLEIYEQNNYDRDLRDWRCVFSRFCLENNILAGDAKLFEEFFDFDISPYKEELHPDGIIEPFGREYWSAERCFKKFFEVCHPDMVKSINLISSL